MSVIDLDDVRATEPARVGAKAASLAALRAAGEPVPDGVVVPPGEEAAAAAERIAARFGVRRLAVRSSSIVEDLASASYAGQYLTVLDVSGRDALIEAIERVRASAVAPSARAYADSRPSDMSVLVMPMIAADAAGVAFAVNPVTGSDEVVIDAVPGVADRLVAGEVTPQRWVIAGDASRTEPGGPTALVVEQARKVAELAKRVSERRGGPQDIEWAIEGGAVYLLQARPITSLPVAPTIEVSKTETWLREDDHYGRPLCPLEFDALCTRMDAGSQIVYTEIGYPLETMRHRVIGGWPYVRMVPLGDRGRDSDKTPPAFLFGLVLRIIPPLRKRIRRAAEMVGSDWAIQQTEAWEQRIKPELRRRVRELRGVDHAALSGADLADHIDQVLELLADACIRHIFATTAMYVETGRLGVFCEKSLGWSAERVFELLGGFSTASSEAGRALAALAETLQGDAAAHALLHDPDALRFHPGPGGAALRAYLDEHGHEVIGFDLSQPTYSEDLRPLLRMLGSRIKRTSAGGEHAADPRSDAERAAADARAALRDRPDELAAFDRMLAAARRAWPLGDDSERDVRLALAVLRYAALDAGARLAAERRLPDPAAVHMLECAELTAALRGANITADVDRRRGELRWARANRGPERYGPAPAAMPGLRWVPRWSRPFLEIMSWVMPHLGGTPIASSPTDTSLRGIAASPGQATGTVRVIHDPAELDRVQPGDVLVCPSTWAAWSVVFPLLAAIVTERGGALSHPAILAREFGIPAVLSVAGATTQLRDGEHVIVDGAAGTVRRVDS